MSDTTTKNKILKIIADHIGVEKDELNEEDFLDEDLHLNPSGIMDLAKAFEENDVDISSLNFSEIETISDIFEALEIYSK